MKTERVRRFRQWSVKGLRPHGSGAMLREAPGTLLTRCSPQGTDEVSRQYSGDGHDEKVV